MLRPDEKQKLERCFKEMEREARRVLRAEGFSDETQRHERALAMRYRGQSFELEIKPGREDVADSFHQAHRERYGYSQEGSAIEIVSARLRSLGLVEELPQNEARLSPRKRVVTPSRDHKFRLHGRTSSVGVYERKELPNNVRLRTPCIVTEYSATTLVPPGVAASIDRQGNLIIMLQSDKGNRTLK
jgi:N-methylhydantoinase A